MKYNFFEYPFQFNEQLLTLGALDSLGFSDYWSGCGDYGTRCITLDGKRYEVTVMDEKEDDTDGYGISPSFLPEMIIRGSAALYFLHDMYDDIFETLGVKAANEFHKLCDKTNMGTSMQSYIRFREQYIDEAYYNEFIKDLVV